MIPEINSIDDIGLKEDHPLKIAAAEAENLDPKFLIWSPEINMIVETIKSILVNVGITLETVTQNGNITSLKLISSDEVVAQVPAENKKAVISALHGLLLNTSGLANYVNVRTDFVTTALGEVVFQFPNVAAGEYTFATQDFVTSLVDGLYWKFPVRLAIDTPIAMIGVLPQMATAPIQGINLVADDRVILMNQANPVHNGIYRVNTGLAGQLRFYRTEDANSGNELNNAIVPVTAGTYANKNFRQSTTNPVIGTNNIVFADFGNVIAQATHLVAGILKLYTTIGVNEDGTMTQKAITNELAPRIKMISLLPGLVAEVTGTTAVTIMQTVLVPANTFKIGDSFVVKSSATQEIFSNSQFNLEVYHDVDTNLAGANLIGYFRTSLATHTFIGGELTYDILAGNVIEYLENNSQSDLGGAVRAFVQTPFNPTVDNYFMFCIKLGNASNKGKLKRIEIFKKCL